MTQAHPDIYVMRHGETEWNAADRMQGWLDSPLTLRGQAQARAQGRLLEHLDLTAMDVFASPSGRAMRTAEIALAGRAVPSSDPRLREINVGDWQGLVRGDLRRRHPTLFRDDDPLFWYDHAPGGEGYLGLEARCRDFLEDLTGPAVIFTHGITSRMLRCLVLGMTPDRLGELPGGQGVVHVIRGGKAEVLGDAHAV